MNHEVSSASREATTRVLLRTGILFLVFALPAAVLDVFTTELARRRGDFIESNPAGFVPLDASVLKEMLLLLLATASVLIGACYRRDALQHAASSSYDQFGAELFSRNAWAVALLGFPLLVAVAGYGVVLSNGFYLILGWSPIDHVTLLPLESLLGNDTAAYLTFYTILVLVLWYPATTLIVRSLYLVHRRP